MATEAQVLANRLNAQKSTGPRTEAGKAVVSQNAVTHGLLGGKTVISGEDPGQFESYHERLLAELHPAGAMEAVLAERIVGLAWRLRRADRLQAEVFDTLLARDSGLLSSRTRSSDCNGSEDGLSPRESALGRATIRDFANYRVLDRLGMYERRIEYSLYKTMGELEKVRQLRPAEPPTLARANEPLCETKPIPQDGDAESGAESRPPACGTERDQLRQGDANRPVAGLTQRSDGRRLVAVAIASAAAAPGRDDAGAGLWEACRASERKNRDEKQNVPFDHDPGNRFPDPPGAGVCRAGRGVESAT